MTKYREFRPFYSIPQLEKNHLSLQISLVLVRKRSSVTVVIGMMKNNMNFTHTLSFGGVESLGLHSINDMETEKWVSCPWASSRDPWFLQFALGSCDFFFPDRLTFILLDEGLKIRGKSRENILWIFLAFPPKCSSYPFWFIRRIHDDPG